MTKPFSLRFQPGVQRDGTALDAERCLDAVWCRWRLGRPRKMGGYKQISGELNGLPQKVHCFYQNGQIISHIGTSAGIQQVVFDPRGNLISIADRTPATFIGGANVGFTMDAIFDTTSNAVQLMVSAVPDIIDLSSNIQTVPFIGIIDQVARLLPFSDPGSALYDGGTWTQPNLAGGIVSVQPYAFGFDINGHVSWSPPNIPLGLGIVGGASGAGQARVSAQKIVGGMPLRGGGVQSPAAIFWSLSEVITAAYIGAAPYFAFNTVSPSSSILSSDVVVEYDGLYFWAGVDRFMVFNGTVTEVPNNQNQDFFFDNLTPGYEARSFAFKVPRYGEVWFCAPMFGSTVPNHAVILNLRENAWYDTPLPDGGRGAGYFAQGSKYPVMTDVVPGAMGYALWLHEYGVDKVVGNTITPILSSFETPWFGGPKDEPPMDRAISFQQFEPDLQQTGDLSVTLVGSPNARVPAQDVATVTLPMVPGRPQEELASFVAKQSLRLSRLRVESNVPGGNYVCGRNLGHADPAEARKTS
jgi:hypothetical protein